MELDKKELVLCYIALEGLAQASVKKNRDMSKAALELLDKISKEIEKVDTPPE